MTHAALSKDLRKPLLQVLDNQAGSRRKLTARFKVNTATITNWLQIRRQAGSYEPRPHGGGVRVPLSFSGAIDTAMFLMYVEQALVPGMRRGAVVIFDSLALHFSPAISGAIDRAGASVLPLPRNRPAFNPIEEMFSKFEAFLRRVGARAREHLYDPIGEGLRKVTPEDIFG